MTRLSLILVSSLVFLSGLALFTVLGSDSMVCSALAQAEPTATRPPVPPLATVTPKPASNDNSEPMPASPTSIPTPTLVPLMAETGGAPNGLLIMLLGIGPLIIGIAMLSFCMHTSPCEQPSPSMRGNDPVTNVSKVSIVSKVKHLWSDTILSWVENRR
jgi:NaMN:DMB phosphoribosyltransferase